MSITSERKSDILHLVHQKYPGWSGFNDSAFRRHETHAKRTVVKKASSLLSESTLAQLLVTRDTASFLDRLQRLGKGSSLLQQSSENMDHGDLEILHVRTLDKPVFCAQIYHLLHGSQSLHERLDAYLNYIEDNELPNTWTFPTYFIQFCFPEQEFFIDPRSIEWFMKFCGVSTRLGRPSVQTYRTVKDIAFDLKQTLLEFQPQDLIDIQSIIQVCAEMNSAALHSAEHQHSDTNGHDGIEHRNGQKQHNIASDYNYNMFSANEEELLWADDASEDSDPTMLFISEVTDESARQVRVRQDRQTGIKESRGLSSPKSNGRVSQTRQAPPREASNIEPESSDVLQNLYKTFMDSFMSSPVGVAQAVEYGKAREMAEQNFSHLIAEHELGEQVTDRVFLHLLPHKETPENYNKGAWIHPIGPISHDLVEALHVKYPQDSTIRGQIGEVILEFTRHCVYKVNALEKSSEALAKLDAISIINLPSITPILQALKPNQYVLLHEAAVYTINRLLDTTYGTGLQELPELNAAGIELIQVLRNNTANDRFPSVQDSDLFDMFSHWLYNRESSDVYERELPPEEIILNEEEVAPPSAVENVPPSTPPEKPAPAPIPTPAPDPTPAPVRAPRPEPSLPSSDPLAHCEAITGIARTKLLHWQQVLARKGSLIFHGPSGTGKTYIAQHFARALVAHSDGTAQLIQFHPGMTHRDFWGDHDGQTEGCFRAFCKEAARRSGPCVFIIDDIDQAKVRDVFGDLLYRFEYRIKAPVSYATKQEASWIDIPQNVFLIGTMCPTEESPFTRDAALSRLFASIPLEPNYNHLRLYHTSTSFRPDELIRTLEQINDAIEQNHYRIGTTYFLRADLIESLESIWLYEIEPALERGLSTKREKLASFRWNEVSRKLLS